MKSSFTTTNAFSLNLSILKLLKLGTNALEKASAFDFDISNYKSIIVSCILINTGVFACDSIQKEAATVQRLFTVFGSCLGLGVPAVPVISGQFFFLSLEDIHISFIQNRSDAFKMIPFSSQLQIKLILSELYRFVIESLTSKALIFSKWLLVDFVLWDAQLTL